MLSDQVRCVLWMRRQDSPLQPSLRAFCDGRYRDDSGEKGYMARAVWT